MSDHVGDGTWTITCVTLFTPCMENSISYRDGILPVESRQAGRVPGPEPQKGPTQSDWWSPHPDARSRASETEGKCYWPKKPRS